MTGLKQWLADLIWDDGLRGYLTALVIVFLVIPASLYAGGAVAGMAWALFRAGVCSVTACS